MSINELPPFSDRGSNIQYESFKGRPASPVVSYTDSFMEKKTRCEKAADAFSRFAASLCCKGSKIEEEETPIRISDIVPSYQATYQSFQQGFDRNDSR